MGTSTAVKESIDTRLSLIHADYTGAKRRAAVPVTLDDVTDDKWIIVRDNIKLGDTVYTRGQLATIERDLAAKLLRHHMITSPAAFAHAAGASARGQFLRDQLFPVEARYHQAKRAESEAGDRVTALEAQLAGARVDAAKMKEFRIAAERELSALLDKAQ